MPMKIILLHYVELSTLESTYCKKDSQMDMYPHQTRKLAKLKASRADEIRPRFRALLSAQLKESHPWDGHAKDPLF